MNKGKIFDIIPPEGKTEGQRKKVSSPVKREKRRPASRLAILYVAAGFLLFLFLGWLLIEPRGEIKIWPKIQQISLGTKVVVGETFPGEFFESQVSFSDRFSATGTSLNEARARGTIRVYNEYSDYPQSLLPNTRFLSDNGKLFRAPERTVVPGISYKEGETVPGWVDVEVVAAGPGEEYNIGPSTFSLPGLSGTASYTKIYAESFEPMSGGAETEVLQITDQDLKDASDLLKEKALEKVFFDLESSLPEDYILMDEAVSWEVEKMDFSGSEGDRTNDFSGEATVKARVLSFKKSDLQDFAVSYAESQIEQEKQIHRPSLQVSYFPDQVNIQEGKITLDLEISGKAYELPSIEELKNMIEGKNPGQIEEIFKEIDQVKKIQVQLWPFWTAKAPADQESLEIKMMIE